MLKNKKNILNKKENDMWDIILQNNSTNQTYLYSGLTNVSLNHLYLEFSDIDLDLPSGEYTIVAIENSRTDVVYEFRTPVLDSIMHTEDGDIKLEDLHPRINLMRIGDIIKEAEYDSKDNNKTFIYYED